MDNEFHITKRGAIGVPSISNAKESCALGALPSPELQVIRDDYRLGQVETVEGWIVSKTEAELIKNPKAPAVRREAEGDWGR